MRRAIFILALFLFSAVWSPANASIARFVFSTEPRTVEPGALSGEIKIQAQDADGLEVKTEETIDLEFFSTSPLGEFLNSSGNPVNTVMAKNTANRTFYYRDSVPGVYNMTVKASGRDSGKVWSVSQPVTISGSASSPPAVSSESSQPSMSSSISSPDIGSYAVEIKRIHAYAGGDKTAVAGSNLEFSGSATGLKDEPLENARFWWNFGNGETKEGRTVNHSFQIPGNYLVGMHVSSGEYSASDYLNVEIVPNKLAVSGVLMGEDGFLRLQNKGSITLDLGGWMLEDGKGERFKLPERTLINAGQEFTLSNAVSGLLLGGATRIKLYYPNTSLALDWDGSGNQVVPRPAVLSEQKAVPEQVVPKDGISSAKTKNPDRDKPEASAPADAERAEEPAVASVAGSPVSSVWFFFSGAVVLGLIAAFGFIFLKSVG